MKLLCAAIVQMNPTVGALTDNADTVIALAREAADCGAALIIFPELALTGYPPEDLVLKRHFLEDCRTQLERMAGELPVDSVIVAGAPWLEGNQTYNSAVVFNGGRIVTVYHKINLPNYGVFDEKRVFAPGNHPLVLISDSVRIGVHICEDAWYNETQTAIPLKQAGIDVLVNLSASPYHRGKRPLREEVVRNMVALTGAPLLYCNMVGGQDEIVFDGAGMALDADGKWIARGRTFEEDIVYAEIPVEEKPGRTLPPECRTATVSWRVPDPARPFPPSVVAPCPDELEEVYEALKTGLRDYANKNGFDKTVIPLSGGLDSALVAVIAVDALGSNRVVGVTMPSHYTSPETLKDARCVAENLGIDFFSVPIRGIYDAFLAELTPAWEGREEDSTEENLQARIRGNLVMALSNKFGWLVLAAGNKSELATGYCTLYGDMVGGFAAIKDVLKTRVYELAEWRNARDAQPPIPQSILDRPPSAELKPGQKDSDTLPPYALLDPIIERYVEHDEGVDHIIDAGHDPDTVKRVARMIDRNEYKRRQAPPGTRITGRAFGKDRRIPITNAYWERA